MKRIRLETERTILRSLEPEDADSFYALNNDPEVIKYTGDKKFKSTGEARDFLMRYDQHKYGTGRFAVIEKISGEFMGWCGLKFSPELNEYDIGFRFFRKHWNKGFATETASRCLQYGFTELKLVRIVGRAMKENEASIQVLKKLGMKFQGVFDFIEHEGHLYAMESEDYDKEDLA